MSENQVFIIGGAFREKAGQLFVQKRSWDMLRIFSDTMAFPVFGMQHEPHNETLAHPLPKKTHIVSLPVISGPQALLKSRFENLYSSILMDTLKASCCVYLRMPLWSGVPISRYAVQMKKKVIVSYHGDWAQAYRSSETSFPRRLANYGISWYVDHILKQMASKSEVLFCVGDELTKRYGKYGSNVTTFANFLHSNNDIAQPHDLCVSAPYKLLFVGSLEEYKGVVYLVKAMGKLKKEGVPTQLTIVGVGSLENKIRSIAKEQSVYDDITFKGYVQHGKELMKTFSDSDIFVLPSISSEGTPKVVMEAMSQALPVIATDIGSTSSMLEDGRNGILIKPKDSDAIAEALKKLINDKVLRTRYVKNGIDLAHRSTNEKQREIIKNAMLQNVSEIVGVPAYFSEMEQKIDGGL